MPFSRRAILLRAWPDPTPPPEWAEQMPEQERLLGVRVADLAYTDVMVERWTSHLARRVQEVSTSEHVQAMHMGFYCLEAATILVILQRWEMVERRARVARLLNGGIARTLSRRHQRLRRLLTAWTSRCREELAGWEQSAARLRDALGTIPAAR